MVKVEWKGIAKLEAALRELNGISFEAVVRKQTTELFERAKQPGGTPVDTGELRDSSGVQGDEMGYTGEYAPHVEYGHRTVGGGFVKGQHFLKNNVDIQRAIYKQDLIDSLNKVK
ncbi:MAG: hypothetical protein ACLSU9_11025 [Anaerovoracaceae bacterium]